MKVVFIKIFSMFLLAQLFFGNTLNAGQRNYRFISRGSVGGKTAEDENYLLRHKPGHGAIVAWEEMEGVAWFPSPPHGLKLSSGDSYSNVVVIISDEYPNIETNLEVKVERVVEMSWGDALFCVWKVDGVSGVEPVGDDRSALMSDLGLRSIFVRGRGAFLLRENGFVPEVGWMDIRRGGKPDIWSDMNTDDLNLGFYSTAWVAMQ